MTIEITNESGVDVDETVLLRLMESNLAELRVSPDADVAIEVREWRDASRVPRRALDHDG